MTTIRIVEDQNEIHNEAGLQIIGSTAPNQSGLSPRELLESALGLCVSISLQKIMDYDKVEYDKSSIAVEVTARRRQDEQILELRRAGEAASDVGRNLQEEADDRGGAGMYDRQHA